MTRLRLFFLSIPDRIAAWIDRICDDFDRNFVHKEDRLREEIDEAQKVMKEKKKHLEDRV